MVGKARGKRNKTGTEANRRPGHGDERKDTAAGFWQRAQAFFSTPGITVEQVLTDNGSCYRSRAGPRRAALLRVRLRTFRGSLVRTQRLR